LPGGAGGRILFRPRNWHDQCFGPCRWDEESRRMGRTTPSIDVRHVNAKTE
jgi:hypothetical protein